MRTKRFRAAMESEGHEVFPVSPRKGFRSGREVRRKARLHRPLDAAVAISMDPALAAVRSALSLPLWIDINGAHIAEMQLRDHLEPTRELLARTIHFHCRLLAAGDRFSTISAAHRKALIGQLLLMGRLDATVEAAPLVSEIEHCALPGLFDPPGWTDGEFDILSSGSFNLWFDHSTLFRAMELASASSPGLRLVCAGGAIPHAPNQYEEFRRLVASSSDPSRYLLRGWLSPEDLQATYHQSRIGVFTDIPCAETELGARTRALDWVSRGIPVICTQGSGVSETIAANRLGLVVPQRDPEALSEAMLRLSGDRALYERIVESQREWCSGPGSARSVFRPLLDWLREPIRAPRLQAPRMCRPTVSSPRSPGFLLWLLGETLLRSGLGGVTARIRRKLSGR